MVGQANNWFSGKRHRQRGRQESVVKGILDHGALRRFWLVGSIAALLAVAVGLILEMGLWQRTEVVYGPFAAESLEGRIVIVPVASGLLLRPVLDVPGDSVGRGNVSDVRGD
jgi:hypothetical protein